MNEPNDMTCSSRIKLERQKRSWTQEQLAERAKLSPRTVQRIESGTEASAETLRLIAEAFGLPAGSLRGGEVRTHFRAPWGRSVKVMTIAVIGLAIALNFLPLPTAHAGLPAAAIPLVLAGVISAGLVFSVNGYSVRDGRLLVHRLGWATRFALTQLSAFEATPHATMGSIRLLGNGGLFCFIGLYRNSVIGRYRAYLTDPANAVVLAFGDRKIVVSPDDPPAFVEALTSATKGICREPDRPTQT